MATRKSKDTGNWPKIVKGTHLTVTTHEDGRTELEWDDQALLNEVRAAMATVEPDTTVVKFTKKKKASAK